MHTAMRFIWLFIAFQLSATSPADLELVDQTRSPRSSILGWGERAQADDSSELIQGSEGLMESAWPSYVEPFLSFIPNTVGEFCRCQALGSCGCCLGFYVKPWGIRNNVCLNATAGPDALSHSIFGIHGKVIYDKTQVLDAFVSEKEASVCLSLIPFNELQGCVKFSDIHYDSPEAKTCICALLELRWASRYQPIFTLPRHCICIGKPVPQSKKRGIFGTTPLLDLIQNAKNFIG